MSLIDTVQLNKKLPFYCDYVEEMDAVKFYECSYKATGTSYTMGEAPDGSIIHRYDCEENKDYKLRCKQTPTRSYVSSIINKYNSSVFRNEPSRLTSNSTYELLLSDADGYGNSLNVILTKALLKAQIQGSCYLLADSTATDTEILTLAQQQAAGVRPYIRVIEKEAVVAYEEVEKKLVSAIVLLEDSEGKTFARYMDSESFIDISIDSKYKVTSISESYSHGYSNIPLAEIEPFEDAQAKAISYNQRTIVNILSLLMQEVKEKTFTQHVLSGVKIPTDEQGNKQTTMNFGSKRLIVLEDSSAKVDTIGSDVAQSQSLRDQIQLESDNLYQSAGFGKQNEDTSNLSGYALSILREDFFLNCSALKTAMEQAENYIMSIIADKEGFEYVPAIYSSRYIVDDNGAELLKLRDILAMDLPATFKNLAVKEYISKFYNVSKEDTMKIEQELIGVQ